MSNETCESPTASNLTKQSVYRLAESIANQIDYKPGKDVKEAVAKLGGDIEIKNFWETGMNDSGSIVVEAPSKFKIYVPANTSSERDRFTIAHELGHYVLHYLWPRNNGRDIKRMVATRYGSERVEWEANWFAAAFLMPEDEFRSKFQESGEDIQSVALYFGVSQAAVKVRAQGLGLTSS